MCSSTDERVKEMWYLYTVLSREENFESFVGKQIDLETIILRERSRSQKWEISCGISNMKDPRYKQFKEQKEGSFSRDGIGRKGHGRDGYIQAAYDFCVTQICTHTKMHLTETIKKWQWKQMVEISASQFESIKK